MRKNKKHVKKAATLGDLGRISGDADSANFINNLLFFYSKTKNGWMYKTAKDFEEMAIFTRRRRETARKTLLNKGFIKEKYGMAGTFRCIYFKLNIQTINKALLSIGSDFQYHIPSYEKKQKCENKHSTSTEEHTYKEDSVGTDTPNALVRETDSVGTDTPDLTVTPQLPLTKESSSSRNFPPEKEKPGVSPGIVEERIIAQNALSDFEELCRKKAGKLSQVELDSYVTEWLGLCAIHDSDLHNKIIHCSEDAFRKSLNAKDPDTYKFGVHRKIFRQEVLGAKERTTFDRTTEIEIDDTVRRMSIPIGEIKISAEEQKRLDIERDLEEQQEM